MSALQSIQKVVQITAYFIDLSKNVHCATKDYYEMYLSISLDSMV